MNLLDILKSITNHPLTRNNRSAAVWRFFKWQVGKLITKKPTIHLFTEQSKLIIQKGMTGATGNLYCGLQDFEEMSFLLHFLRPDDLFIDIGANIGSYTVLASGQVGAKTIAFEPVPSTFKYLLANISINNLQKKVTALPIALGAIKGNIEFAISKDMMNNHVAEKNEMADKLEVPVVKLDDVMADQLDPALIKIDVEGYETDVLKGAINTLQNKHLKVIIIELMGLGKRYGFDENVIHEFLLNLDFKPAQYDPFLRKIKILQSYGKRNTIYIRDLNFVESRIQTAEKIRILNQIF